MLANQIALKKSINSRKKMRCEARFTLKNINMNYFEWFCRSSKLY